MFTAELGANPTLGAGGSAALLVGKRVFAPVAYRPKLTLPPSTVIRNFAECP